MSVVDNQKQQKSESYSGPGWVEIIMLMLIFSVATLMVNKYVPFFSPAPAISQDNKVVLVDTKALFAAMVDDMKSRISGDNTDTVLGSGTQFAKKLDAIVRTYVDKGYIVLHTRDALSFPSDKDITHMVAKQLGIVIGYPTVGK